MEADAIAKAKELSTPKTRSSVLPQVDTEDKSIPYIDESYLPSYNEVVEYNDEYDDTYDEGIHISW